MSERNRWGCWLGLLSLVSACSLDVPRGEPGSPWARTRGADLQTFNQGRVLFQKAYATPPGKSPSPVRCSACHEVPALGGAGVARVRDITRDNGGRCERVAGSGPHFGTSRQGASGAIRALIAPPSLYGLGAIEAIPDEEILKRADPNDEDEDGISGRVARAVDGGVGRFGRKGTASTLRAFAEASLAELGLTVSATPSIAGSVKPRSAVLDSQNVSELTHYLRLLAFPKRDSTLVRDSIRDGKQLFERIGCAKCHTPQLRAARSSIRAVRGRSVPLYSDLLLHNMGPGLASICAPGVASSEWRTAPLYGLRLRPQLLHDGRVQTIESAIRMHGGEAEASRAQFETLSPREQEQLLRFLRSL